MKQTSVVPTWRTSLDWDSAAMEFVDAFSVDNYTNNADWISRYEAYGKPLLNLEYTFSTTDQGLSPVNAATSVASIADRGLAFKSFVESQTAHPLFIGSGYFSYYDQAVTGRKDGENFNIGLLNQQDQPYTDMVNIMKIRQCRFGKCTCNWDNPAWTYVVSNSHQDRNRKLQLFNVGDISRDVF